VRAADVRDPRIGHQALPTPCVAHTAPGPNDVNYIWNWCP